MIFSIIRTSGFVRKPECPLKNEKYKMRKVILNGGESCFWEIQIDTLEQLMELIQDCGEDIILSRSENDASIEIYDDYRE